MSILLGMSMMLSVENHEGAYNPVEGDVMPFMGKHFNGAAIAPNGVAIANKLTTVAGIFTYSVVDTWNGPPVDCTVIKEVCADQYLHCSWQKVKYRLVSNSPIGETNSVVSMQFIYSGLDAITRSAIYFHECGGFRAHDVESLGKIQVIFR